MDATVGAQVLFDVVSDLGSYPEWLDIVARTERIEPGGPDSIWLVDLRAQVGPLRRSKRLRMERTVCEPPFLVRFERRELDGRSHSDWVLSATLDDTDTGVRLTMHLHYGGSLWLPALDRILGEEIRRSSARLVSMVQETT